MKSLLDCLFGILGIVFLARAFSDTTFDNYVLYIKWDVQQMAQFLIGTYLIFMSNMVERSSSKRKKKTRKGRKK